MNKRGMFLIFVFRLYREEKRITEKETSALFTKCRLWNEIYSAYEDLSSADKQTIVRCIDEKIIETNRIHG